MKMVQSFGNLSLNYLYEQNRTEQRKKEDINEKQNYWNIIRRMRTKSTWKKNVEIDRKLLYSFMVWILHSNMRSSSTGYHNQMEEKCGDDKQSVFNERSEINVYTKRNNLFVNNWLFVENKNQFPICQMKKKEVNIYTIDILMAAKS